MRGIGKLIALGAIVASATFAGTTTKVVGSAPVPAANAIGPGAYIPLTPARILDTRNGTGGLPVAKIGPDAKIDVQVNGRGGVPATGVSAVVVNVTETGSTAGGFFTVWPAGTARPVVSSLNFTTGLTVANLVTVPVGANGKISIYNQKGQSHAIADVLGYYAASATTPGPAGGDYFFTFDDRLYDSRVDAPGPLGPYEALEFYLDYGSPYNEELRAVAINLTVVTPQRSGFLSVTPGVPGEGPSSSTLNFPAGRTIANMAIVPVRPCDLCDPGIVLPSFEVTNYSAGVSHILVDVVGVYDNGLSAEPGLRFRPIAPQRIVDTRLGVGTTEPGPGVTRVVEAPASVASGDTLALVSNVTAVLPTSPNTYLTLWAGGPRPGISNLNATSGRVVPNHAHIELDENYDFSVFNHKGFTDVLVDVVGAFDLQPLAPAQSQAQYEERSGAAPFVLESSGAERVPAD